MVMVMITYQENGGNANVDGCGVRPAQSARVVALLRRGEVGLNGGSSSSSSSRAEKAMDGALHPATRGRRRRRKKKKRKKSIAT